MSVESTTVKVHIFDGEEENYQIVLVQFEAFARVKGINSVLVDAGITISESDVETLELMPKYGSGTTGARNANEEKQYRLGKRNLMAMAHLTMAFNSEALINKIPTAETNDWPGGLVYKLMDTLKVRYAPNDQMTVVEQTQKLNNLEMTAGKNPANLFEGIKTIDNQYGKLSHNLVDDDKIAAVLEKAPTKYLVILANTAHEKGN